MNKIICFLFLFGSVYAKNDDSTIDMIFLLSIQGVAEYADGYATLYGKSDRSIIIKREIGIAKYFIGEYPTWPRMIFWGSLELVAASAITYKMKTSKIIILRRIWWITPVALAAIHFYFYDNNMKEFSSHF